MMNKNSLASKVTNIDGVPKRGMLRRNGTDVLGNVKNVPHAAASVDTARKFTPAVSATANFDHSSTVEKTSGSSYADMTRTSGMGSGSLGTNINLSQLDQIQRLIDVDPMNPLLIDREAKLLASFRMASLDEERFLKQKSKVYWLAEGDANTKYFHNTLKCRNHWARIDVITDRNGILHEGKEVPKAFVDHYVGFLGREEAVIIPITQELFDVRIDQDMSVDMIREVTFDEIKRTMFSFADDKAPGPDGFTAAFYKKAWEIVVLRRAVSMDSSFRFHNRCEKLMLINLCFADDLFLFAKGELNSAKEL
ncbi:hypothetical protein QVD17_39575 [Tagetes erecta]|uniref:RNA-directed DNA polymerase, eukaryota, reverse transcriptase zinc-binding domain protein n=1 Tax=Tagetes erecta TaxID=13708 RepID=A0AAD8JNT0_TARER|nr:hypothetical protein QVD17_39575 [Tagetes erecta]